MQQIELPKIGIANDQLQPHACWAKNLVNIGPLTKKFRCLTSTYPKSTVRVLRMLMHLTSGHVTLLAGEFHPPTEFFSKSDLGRRADSRWALP